MSIRLLNGTPLLVDGSVAIHADCCCTPACLPNSCIIPSNTNCFRCYAPLCNGGQCLEWQTIEVAVDGVGNVVTVPSIIPVGSCRTGFNCNCDVFNSSFIHSFSSGCSTSWIVREVSPPFALFDTCGTPQTLACNNWQIERQVFVRVAVANQQVSYATGAYNSVSFPNAYTLGGVGGGGSNTYIVCNNYTITPGHYVVVELNMIGRVGGTGGGILYSNQKVFVYSFGNGVKVDAACAEDQYYPSCGPYIGGNATLVVSRAWRRNSVTDTSTFYTDCSDVPELCQLASATVTIEPPVIQVCPMTPPLPPL